MDILTTIPKETFYIGIKVILILLGASILLRTISVSRQKLEKRISKSKRTEEQTSQFQTITLVGEYILRVFVIFIAAVWLLSLFGVNILPLITTVGVAGLALTLGAQTIIKDYIGGVIILLENLYYVGDTITIGSNTGVVEKITLRSTYLRNKDHQIIIIPNGDIRIFILEVKSRKL